jgi:hypothetical protein
MAETELPKGTEEIRVRVSGSSIEAYEGTLVIKRWTPQEARARALKRTLRIVAMVSGFSLIGLIVHILLLVIIPTLTVTILGSVVYFFKLTGETTTFFFANSVCPGCRQAQRLKPFLDTGLQNQMTLICPECGQTAKAVQIL